MEKIGLVRTRDGKSFLVPFILITSLFFLWGVAHSILDVLNKHFQDTLEITRTRSALIQAVVYGGYFIMALPAGRIIRRFGYRTGVLTGLVLYGIGALLKTVDIRSPKTVISVHFSYSLPMAMQIY